MNMDNSRLDEQEIEQLLRAAGHRQGPPDEMRERVYGATLQAWQALPEQAPSTSRKPRRLAIGSLAVAASLAFATLIGLLLNNLQTPAEHSVGEIVYVQGEYQLDQSTADSLQVLAPATSLRTGAGHLLSLRLTGGAVLTLDEETALRVISAHEVQLQGGRIYVDVGEGDHHTPQLAVITQQAKIVDIGTQFEVQTRVSNAGQQQLRVAVRQGRVDVVGAQQTYTASARAGVGEELLVLDSQLLARNSLQVTDQRWDWRRAGRAPYALNDSTVYDYLQWMARDSGYQLRFTSRAVEQMAKIGVLQSQAGLTSDETSISDTLAATRFEIQQPQEGLWLVRFRSTSQ